MPTLFPTRINKTYPIRAASTQVTAKKRLTVLALALLLGISPAQAGVYAVPDGSSFAAAGVPETTLASGSVINLTGDASIAPNNVTINPGAAPGAADLTINVDAPSGNSLVTLGIHGGFYSNTPVRLDILGGQLTLKGGLGVSIAGESIFGSNLTINAPKGLVLLSNQNDTRGGAIYGDEAVTINGVVIANGNTAGSYGGVIYGGNTLTIDGTLTADHNTAGAGGLAFANRAITVTGAVTATHNTAFFGGAFAANNIAGGGVTSDVALATDTGDVVLSNNQATRTHGGAIYASGNTALGNAAGRVSLIENTATASGGAVLSAKNIAINGALTAENNQAAQSGGALSAGNAVTLTGAAQVSANKAGSYGGAIYAGGGVALNAVSGGISFSGNTQQNATATPQANAIYLNNSNGAATLTLNAAGYPITFYDPIQNNAANGLIPVLATGGGAVVFDGAQHTTATDRWSQVYGNTQVSDGTTFAVRNDAIYGVLASDVGQTTPTSFKVDAGATLAGGIVGGTVRTDDFILNGALHIAGAAPAGNASGGFSVLNVNSPNLSLGAGSAVQFNTYLNDAGTQRSDRLDLNLNGGATHGTATVVVTNVGGSGALTLGDGIELVRVVDGNGTTADAFTLGHRVVAGPYEYLLYQGGQNSANAQNWYLRSTLNCELQSSSPACGGGSPPSSNPGTDPPSTPSNPGTDNPGANNPDTNNPDTNNPDTNNPGTNNPGTDSPSTPSNPGTDPSPPSSNPGDGSPSTPSNPGADSPPSPSNPGTDPSPPSSNPGADSPSSPSNPGTDSPPAPSNPGTEIVPDYRPEISLYAIMPSMLLTYNQTLLDSLGERMGDEAPGMTFVDNRTDLGGGTGLRPSLGWARVILQNGSAGDAGKGIYGFGPRYHYNTRMVQAGLDLYRAPRADGGSDRAGLYVAFGSMNASVKNWTGRDAGVNTLTGYTVGGYWTRFNANGWYADAVAQYTRANLSSKPIGLDGLSTHGDIFAASIQAGKAIALGNDWRIEPQAQLTYQIGSMADTSDAGAQVRFAGIDALSSRLGVRIAKRWQFDDGDPRCGMTLWARPSLGYTFTGKPSTAFSSDAGYVPFYFNTRGSWVQLAAGIDAQLSRHVALYASGFYQDSLSSRGKDYGGKVGVRIVW